MSKKIIVALLSTFFITSAIAQSGNMVFLKIITGSDDLRRNSSAFIRLNLTDGTSTPEIPIYRSSGSLSSGFPQGSSKDITVNLPRTINLIDINSFTIRHD